MSLILDGSNGVSDIDGTAATPAIRGTDANTGIFFPAADTIAFSEGGAEAMRIDSSGNVGIGTSSPTNPGSFGRVLNIDNADGSALYLSDDGSVGQISMFGTSMSINNRANGATLFSTNATERMRILSNGVVQVQNVIDINRDQNTTTALSVGAVIRFAGAGAQYGMQFIPTNNNTSAIYFSNAAGGGVGQITTTATTTSYTSLSDYRLKENIAPMTGALDKVSSLKPVTYKWKVDGSASQGFIAHELQAVVPDCVTGEKDAVDEEGNPVYQGIDTSFLVATLTASIQELKAIVDAQAARIAALEGTAE
jgi:hypothetical protein